jgi:hypothetical protein
MRAYLIVWCYLIVYSYWSSIFFVYQTSLTTLLLIDCNDSWLLGAGQYLECRTVVERIVRGRLRQIVRNWNEMHKIRKQIESVHKVSINCTFLRFWIRQESATCASSISSSLSVCWWWSIQLDQFPSRLPSSSLVTSGTNVLTTTSFSSWIVYN